MLQTVVIYFGLFVDIIIVNNMAEDQIEELQLRLELQICGSSVEK